MVGWNYSEGGGNVEIYTTLHWQGAETAQEASNHKPVRSSLILVNWNESHEVYENAAWEGGNKSKAETMA